MQRWTTKSSRTTQLAMAVGSLIVGVLLMYLCRDYGTVWSDTFAGLLLGLLLAVIGAAGVVATARQTVVIDPLTRTITVEDRRLWGTASRTIAFADVVAVRIGYLGKRSNFQNHYYLDLKLRSGGTYSLFAPGRGYSGSSSRATVEGWRERLETYLAAAWGTGPSATPGAAPSGPPTVWDPLLK